MRAVCLVLSLLGTVIFGGALAYSLADPVGVETLGRELVRREVERRVGERLDDLKAGRIADLASRLSERNRERIAEIERRLREELPAKIAAITREMRDPDCACRKVAAAILPSLLERAGLAEATARLETLIRSKYMEVAGPLTREFRIFTGANALVFAALGIVTLLRRRAGLHLLPPLVILLGSAAIVGYLYLFTQNWFQTIVFGDYVGLAYFAYLGLAVLWLADILLNHARVTTGILNSIGNAFGAASSVSPC